MAGNSNEDVSGAPAGNMMATTVSSNNLAQSDSNLALGQINSSSRSAVDCDGFGAVVEEHVVEQLLEALPSCRYRDWTDR